MPQIEKISGKCVNRRVNRTTRTVASGNKAAKSSGNLYNLQDPEAPYLRWGRVVDTAPQVRVRRAHDRARDQLADLAVLNQRLSMASNTAAETKAEVEAAAAVRRRVDYLKRRRRNWELVYQYVTNEDALCTLETIEEANRKIEAALSEGTTEGAGVGAMKRRLEELQKEVGAAQTKLDLTQARLESNIARIEELKEEARRLQKTHDDSDDDSSIRNTASSAAAVKAKAALTLAPPATPQRQLDNQQQASPSPSILSSNPIDTERREALIKRRGLQSSLELEDELRNHWFAVQFADKVKSDMMLPFELFGESWVLFRDAQGRAACVRDECAHRACPLSAGSCVDGELQCAYHGWKFNGSGECTAMPSTKFCRGIRVSALPIEEADGLIWVWPGWREAGAVPLGATLPPAGYTIHSELELEVPVEHGLLIENLLDLAHAPFTHTSTFARGWAVPDVVSFQAGKMLSGNWNPYPIDMAFNPPCMTASLIGLSKPGQLSSGARALDCANHLHQVHICLPSKKGHTRLLYRMSMDFMGWVKYIPGIQSFWKSIAQQVLGEDLVLVTGQQARLEQGGDTWSHPVSYDKIAVRYRRWRNAVAEGGADGSTAVAQAASARANAGEIFDVDDDRHVYFDGSDIEEGK
ncbi:putative Chlorophyllide a oxygenase, chloroplastic [Nannochloris sp. 'desiccata']|nr:putative Chlorophyllide a oxygenase, chloroplastic [Chlorella desiccata (nom. nud.)]